MKAELRVRRVGDMLESCCWKQKQQDLIRCESESNEKSGLPLGFSLLLKRWV